MRSTVSADLSLFLSLDLTFLSLAHCRLKIPNQLCHSWRKCQGEQELHDLVAWLQFKAFRQVHPGAPCPPSFCQTTGPYWRSWPSRLLSHRPTQLPAKAEVSPSSTLAVKENLSLPGPGLLGEIEGCQVTLLATNVLEAPFFSIIPSCLGFIQSLHCQKAHSGLDISSSFLGISSAKWLFPSSASGQP